MSNINVMGTYSGITMDTIDQLIEAESARGVKFTQQKSKIEREKNAWKDINTRLDSLFNKLESFSKDETFQSRTVTSNVKESSILTVSAGEKAAVGQYRVHVKQLAEATRITGNAIEINGERLQSIDEELNLSGTFSFGLDGGQSYEITVTAEDSLRDITTAINEQTKESGIQASIVDNRLVLTDTNLGESVVTVQADTNGVAAGLGFTETTESVSGESAIFTVNGIEITRNSNEIDDAVEGLTFTLSNTHSAGESEVITVETDTEKTTQAVKDFVEQYNSVMGFIEDQMDVGVPGEDNNTAGALTGDGTLMRLQSGLRSIMTRNLEGDFSGDFKNLEDIGITIDRYGVASLDEAAFNEALQTDPTNVARFFYSPDTTPPRENEAGEITTPAQEQEGMSELLRNFIDTYISTSTTLPGVIKNKNETYDNMLKAINKDIEIFNERIERKRDRYIQQFTALDIAMMQAQSQMDYLYSQIGMASPNQQ